MHQTWQTHSVLTKRDRSLKWPHWKTGWSADLRSTIAESKTKVTIIIICHESIIGFTFLWHYSVWQYFLIGKYSISGNISHNALSVAKTSCVWFNNLHRKLHWLKVLRYTIFDELKIIFIYFLCFKKKMFTCVTKLINC